MKNSVRLKQAIRVLVAVGFSMGCAPAMVASAGEPEPTGSVAPVVQSAETMANLYILNSSGAPLFASNQDVTDNGILIVSLPRMTYQKVRIATGPHEFRFKDFPHGPRVATLNAEQGNTYYLGVGYSPGRSWALPFAGDPLVIKLISEEDAVALMKEMKEM